MCVCVCVCDCLCVSVCVCVLYSTVSSASAWQCSDEANKLACSLLTEAMYMTGELWEQMLNAEKEKVKDLEKKYAEKMKAKGVSMLLLWLLLLLCFIVSDVAILKINNWREYNRD